MKSISRAEEPVAAWSEALAGRSTNDPKVSVVITCYNYGRFLEQAVMSVARQPGVRWEVLIVDDASTDSSWEVAQRLAGELDRVRARRNVRNQGMIATVNEAMWNVNGDYVVKLDADDMLTPGSLERSVALLEAKPHLSFVYGAPVFFTDTPPVPRTRVVGWQVWSGRDWIELRCKRAYNCIAQPEAVIRRAALERVGHYRPELPHTSDLDMWLRLASVGDVGRVLGADQGWYRVHAQSMQHTIHSGVLTDLRERLRAFESFCASQPEPLADSARLLRMARRALALEALGLACSAYKRGLEDSEPVNDLVTFATETDPECQSSRLWRELSLRRERRACEAIRPTLVIGPILRKWHAVSVARQWRKSGI
jgi:cellulose synthase/poly-beta-1,6-N-acetylglucosamine synthase-like glycosyltransferase